MNVKPNPDSVESLPFADDEWQEALHSGGRTRIAEDTDWREKLVMGKNKAGDLYVIPCGANVETVLRYHPLWRGVIAYDQFADFVIKSKPAPWPVKRGSDALGEWSDDDTTDTIHWLAREEHMIAVGLQSVEGAINVTAKANAYHPVRDYLSALVWDGKPRLAKCLSTYFGAADNDYTRGVGKRWMISAIARIFQPGSQADCALILEGPQGIGKTTALQALVHNPKWYADSAIDMGSKDSLQNLRSVWIYGLDELDSLKRSEVTRTKNFISTREDRYRPSFGRRARTFPRQCVFCGSTNEAEYLPDRTGNRRFLPVRILRQIDVAAIRRDHDQLWAEAMVCFKAGHPWHVDTPEFRALCQEEQEERTQRDQWESIVAQWLTSPKHWESGRPFVPVGQGVLTVEIMQHALGKKLGDITKADEMRVSQVLRSLGYERGPLKREGDARVRRFSKNMVSPLSQPQINSVPL